jgi:iron complex transport system ATP-binding protein
VSGCTGTARQRPAAGTVHLEGAALTSYSARERAFRLAMLPQSMSAPDGITVTELVGRGRFAHQRMLRRFAAEDRAAVDDALVATDLTDLADRRVDELSGGQRQRAWLAMVLAQATPVVLLDEPTTFLDLSHQLEVLDVLDRLVAEVRTVVAVFHELTLAARYADHVIAMKDGEIVAAGPPADTVTPQLVEDVFGLRGTVIPDPLTGAPIVVPADTRTARVTDRAAQPG